MANLPAFEAIDAIGLKAMDFSKMMTKVVRSRPGLIPALGLTVRTKVTIAALVMNTLFVTVEIVPGTKSVAQHTTRLVAYPWFNMPGGMLSAMRR